jgi:hypothetical protein
VEVTTVTTHATAVYEGKSWDETPLSGEKGGVKVTRASVLNAFRGDIVGEGTLEYLMVYRENGTVAFIGLERVVGRIGDRSGTFVLQHDGTFESEAAIWTWTVVLGSGTGDLRGLRGAGGYNAGHAHPPTVTLDYDFE